MIDTDKYEGHTPAPWEIHGDRICAQAACTPVDNVGGNIATVAHKGVLSDNEPNKQLIADAPLLLEEVKGWHKVRDYILEKASYPTVKKLHLKDLLNFMEKVIA